MEKKIDYNKFFEELKITENLKIEEDLGNGYVKLKISEAERRQALQDIKSVEDIVVELLRNSRDAKAKNIFIATKKFSEKNRKIIFIDDGIGIPPKFHDLIFQSRVTSKLEGSIKDSYGFHGRGMALFSIKLNVEKIFIVFSNLNKGTCLSIEINLEKIYEKKDQSIKPKVINHNGNIYLSGGVSNLNKILMEFVIQNPQINVYFGSPTQIIYTMIKNQKIIQDTHTQDIANDNIDIKDKKYLNRLEKLENFFNNEEIKITQLPYFSSTPKILDEVLKKYFDISISQRNLERIFYNEIDQLDSVNDFIFKKNSVYIKANNSSDNNEILLSEALTNSLNSLNYKELDIYKNSVTYKNSITGNKRGFKLELLDENKLANRLKDNEINCIIKVLKDEILKYCSKYFIEIAGNIKVLKKNNKIIFNVELKQKNKVTN